MCIKIQAEDRDLIEKMDLACEHAKLDLVAAHRSLAAAFQEALAKDNIDLIVEPWNRYQEGKKKHRDQYTGLWNYIKEKYPDTRNGDWTFDLSGWELREKTRSLLDKFLAGMQTAVLNRQAAQLHPSPAASVTEPAAA